MPVAHRVELTAEDERQQVVELQHQQAMRSQPAGAKRERLRDLRLVRQGMDVDHKVCRPVGLRESASRRRQAVEPGPTVMACELHHGSADKMSFAPKDRLDGLRRVCATRRRLDRERGLGQPRRDRSQLCEAAPATEPEPKRPTLVRDRLSDPREVVRSRLQTEVENPVHDLRSAAAAGCLRHDAPSDNRQPAPSPEVHMRVRPGELHGVLVFEPTPVSDDRGFFTRTFDAKAAADAGLDMASFVQDSQSRSFRGVVRGLHYRHDGGEGKLVRCSYGRVYDVAVDLRPSSPTYLRYQAVVLDDVDHVSVFLPAGLAHGFQALTDVADVCYRIDAEHRPEAEVGIAWNDPQISIAWPQPVALLSDRDRRHPSLGDVLTRLQHETMDDVVESDGSEC